VAGGFRNQDRAGEFSGRDSLLKSAGPGEGPSPKLDHDGTANRLLPTRRKLLVAAIAAPVIAQQRLGLAPTRNDPPEPLV
jgi:hypothetical protein